MSTCYLSSNSTHLLDNLKWGGGGGGGGIVDNYSKLQIEISSS